MGKNDLKIEDYWKRGFWHYLKYPIYFVADGLGIMSHWDKYRNLKFGLEVCNKLDELEKRVNALERGKKNGRKRTSRSKNKPASY